MDLHLPDRFHARFHGEGKRTVILGQGFGASQASWQSQVSRLAHSGYRVLTYDLAGTTPGTLSLYQAERHGNLFGFAEDLVALLLALGLKGVHYVGHSAGGMVGILAANSQPGLFRTLSLVGASARYIDDPETGYVGGFSRGQVEELIASMRSDYAAWANGFARLMVGNPDRPHLAIEFSRSLLTLRPDIASAVLESILLADHRRDAERVRLPTQVMQTEQDPAVPLEAARWLFQATHATDLQIIPTQGHFPHVSDPQDVSAALLGFLGKHAGT
jgi:sigma-B regulation protein RsbQ